MSNGKSDLHVHFHGGVGQGANLVINVPSTGALAQQLESLKQTLLSKQELTSELATAIQLLTSKVKAVDDVVIDSPSTSGLGNRTTPNEQGAQS